MRRALVIGIDNYPTAPLNGCVNDAVRIAQSLQRHADGSPNFDVVLLTSNDNSCDLQEIDSAVARLFEGDADTVVLFFAGHGLIDEEKNVGFLVTTDGSKPTWGYSLNDLITKANQAYPRIKSTVIILDCCHAGFAGEVSALSSSHAALIGNGLTILTACKRDGTAAESGGQGLFTDLVLEGLAGSASDVCGNVTPASLYALVDQTLGPWDQRPVYKANVQNFITLRTVVPKVELATLRKLAEWFPTASHRFALDPTYEEDRTNAGAEICANEPIADHVEIFKALQKCNRHGLVRPVGEEHMYYAAINSTSCELTALGVHYRKLAELKRI
jgi:Caspase domain